MTGDMQVHTTATGRVVITLPEWWVQAIIIRLAEISRNPRTAESFDRVDVFGNSGPQQVEALAAVRDSLGEVSVEVSRMDACDLADLLRAHACSPAHYRTGGAS